MTTAARVFKEVRMTQYFKRILGCWSLFTIEFWTVNEIELLVFADLLVSTNRWPNAGWVACCFLWSQEKGWYHLLSFTVIHYTWIWLQLPAPLAKSSHAHTDIVSSLLKLNYPSSSCQKLNRKTLHQRVCVHLWQTLSRCSGKSCTHTHNGKCNYRLNVWSGTCWNMYQIRTISAADWAKLKGLVG